MKKGKISATALSGKMCFMPVIVIKRPANGENAGFSLFLHYSDEKIQFSGLLHTTFDINLCTIERF